MSANKHEMNKKKKKKNLTAVTDPVHGTLLLCCLCQKYKSKTYKSLQFTVKPLCYRKVDKLMSYKLSHLERVYKV